MTMGFGILFILLISIGISLLVTVPLVGTLVRFRANYNPKALHLDTEGGAVPYTGPLVTSWFGMFQRVRRIEGIGGLYKGIMPNALAGLFISLIAAAALDASPKKPGGHGRYSAVQDTTPLRMFFYTLMMLMISLPITIVTNRSITTPYKLPWLNPIASLRVLLTPTERRRPWILYLTPGLFIAEVLHVVYSTLILYGIRLLILPPLGNLEPGDELPKGFTPLRLGLYGLVVVFSTLILTPLEVITTRLSIQRNQDPTGTDASVAAAELSEESLEYYGTEEDVIGLRGEEDPYESLMHCATSIINEEGLGTLYRAWWLTLLGGLFGAFTG